MKSSTINKFLIEELNIDIDSIPREEYNILYKRCKNAVVDIDDTDPRDVFVLVEDENYSELFFRLLDSNKN